MTWIIYEPSKCPFSCGQCQEEWKIKHRIAKGIRVHTPSSRQVWGQEPSSSQRKLLLFVIFIFVLFSWFVIFVFRKHVSDESPPDSVIQCPYSSPLLMVGVEWNHHHKKKMRQTTEYYTIHRFPQKNADNTELHIGNNSTFHWLFYWTILLGILSLQHDDSYDFAKP